MNFNLGLNNFTKLVEGCDQIGVGRSIRLCVLVPITSNQVEFPFRIHTSCEGCFMKFDTGHFRGHLKVLKYFAFYRA